MTANLTVSDVSALAEITNACSETAKVAWVSDYNGEVFYGTARAITRANGSAMFIDRQTDVRDAWVWITMRGGWENWVSVQKLMDSYQRGEFQRYDW